MIVKGGDLKAAWDATMIAIVQGLINMGVQAVASAVLAATANQAAAAASAGAWAGAATGIGAALLSIGAAAKALWIEALLPLLVTIGEAIMAFLSAVAAAMKATIFGIPIGIAILIGVAAIGAALVAMKAIKLAEGGIVTGPTLAMVGEAGPEAVIPLDRAGMGMGGVQTIIVPVNLNRREIMRVIVEDLPSALRKASV